VCVARCQPVDRSATAVGDDIVVFASTNKRIVAYNTTSATVVAQSSFEGRRFSFNPAFVCVSFENNTLMLLRLPSFELLYSLPFPSKGSFECTESMLLTAVYNATSSHFDTIAYHIPANLSQLTTLQPKPLPTWLELLENTDERHRVFDTVQYRLVSLASSCSFQSGLAQRDAFSNRASIDCAIPPAWGKSTLRMSQGSAVTAITVTAPSELHVLVPADSSNLDNQTLDLSALPRGTRVHDIQVYDDRLLLLTLTFNTSLLSMHLFAPVVTLSGIQWLQVWQQSQQQPPDGGMMATVAMDAGVFVTTSPLSGSYPLGRSSYIRLYTWTAIVASWPVRQSGIMTRSAVPVWQSKPGYTVQTTELGLPALLPSTTASAHVTHSTLAPSFNLPSTGLPSTTLRSLPSTKLPLTTPASMTSHAPNTLWVALAAAASVIVLGLGLGLAYRCNSLRTAYSQLRQQAGSHQVGT